jgi:hypothetical protein
LQHSVKDATPYAVRLTAEGEKIVKMAKDLGFSGYNADENRRTWNPNDKVLTHLLILF